MSSHWNFKRLPAKLAGRRRVKYHEIIQTQITCEYVFVDEIHVHSAIGNIVVWHTQLK